MCVCFVCHMYMVCIWYVLLCCLSVVPVSDCVQSSRMSAKRFWLSALELSSEAFLSNHKWSNTEKWIQNWNQFFHIFRNKLRFYSNFCVKNDFSGDFGIGEAKQTENLFQEYRKWFDHKFPSETKFDWPSWTCANLHTYTLPTAYDANDGNKACPPL